MNRRGFTLMEIMIAVAITGMMGAIIAMAFQTGFTAREQVEKDAMYYRMLRGAMNRMTREISAAYVSDRYDPKRYRDQNDRPTNFIGERDNLTFSALANVRMYSDAKESDQLVIEYSLKTSTERDARGRTDLFRRADPLVDDRMDRDGTEDVLFEGARKIEFEYWDSDRKEWVSEWDTRRMEKKALLPTRVKITLTAIDESGKEAQYTTQARIALNREFGRYD